jgi:hypothetical protein
MRTLCVEENNVTQSNESVYQGPVNITPENLSSTALPSEEENIPEIEVTPSSKYLFLYPLQIKRKTLIFNSMYFFRNNSAYS